MSTVAEVRQRVPRHVHLQCHIRHVTEWPLHAKVFITWGIQGWVPGVVIGYQRTRVKVRITGRAQSGADVTGYGCMRHRGYVSRSANNVIARRSDQFPPKYIPESCVIMASRRTQTSINGEITNVMER